MNNEKFVNQVEEKCIPYEVLNTIQNQDIYDKEELTKFFWDMFVIDAFLENFDRHNGNWGFLKSELGWINLKYCIKIK